MVNNINLDSVNERLSKLERSNRMLRKTVIALSLFLIVVPILGWQVTTQFFKVIETEKLVLKDSKGKERAVLLMDGDVVKFRLKNSKDSIMATMGADDKEGYINLNAEYKREYAADNEKEKSNLYISSNHTALSKSDKRVFGWGINDAGYSYLVIGSDSSKNTNIFQGSIILKDWDGISRIAMDAQNQQSMNTEIILRSNRNDSYQLGYGKGANRLALYYGPELNGLYLYDENSNLRTAIGKVNTKDNKGRKVSDPESSIWLFDQNGNSVFTAPN